MSAVPDALVRDFNDTVDRVNDKLVEMQTRAYACGLSDGKAEVERLVRALFTIRRLTMRRDGLEHVARVAVDAVLSYDEPQQPTEAAKPTEDE